MVAAPQNGTMTVVDLKGNAKVIDFYVSDVANALLRWDSGAGAGANSDVSYFMPADGFIRDISIVTGLTDTTKFLLTKNGVATGNTVRYTVHLTTLNNRPVLNIPFSKGDRVGGIQLA